MMGALDQKYEMAIRAIRREAAKRSISVKEMTVRIVSDAGYLGIPLWREDIDQKLIGLSAKAQKGGAS